MNRRRKHLVVRQARRIIVQVGNDILDFDRQYDRHDNASAVNAQKPEQIDQHHEKPDHVDVVKVMHQRPEQVGDQLRQMSARQAEQKLVQPDEDNDHRNAGKNGVKRCLHVIRDRIGKAEPDLFRLEETDQLDGNDRDHNSRENPGRAKRRHRHLERGGIVNHDRLGLADEHEIYHRAVDDGSGFI